jgi:hypothetical protein
VSEGEPKKREESKGGQRSPLLSSSALLFSPDVSGGKKCRNACCLKAESREQGEQKWEEKRADKRRAEEKERRQEETREWRGVDPEKRKEQRRG